MIAAVSPTSCLEIPLTTTRVGCGTSNSIPCGARIGTGREYPTESSRSLPFLRARAVAAALDLQPLLEAAGDALDHVLYESARQPVQRTVFATVGRSFDE